MSSRDVHLSAGVASTVDDVLEIARLSEDLGYDRFWVPETWGLDAVTSLGVVATETDRIGLGSGVLNTFSRSPALLGQTATTLQHVSDGRFRLGIGPSSPGVVEDWHGVDFERPLRVTRETIEVVNDVTTGNLLGYDGDVFDSAGTMRLRCDTPETRPPVDVAALGPKAVELAGRFGDGWCAFLFSPRGMRDRLSDFRRGAKLGGGDPTDSRVVLTVVCCALEDGERAREVVRRELSYYFGIMGEYYNESLARQGYEDEASQISTAWSNGNRKRALEAIGDDLLDDLTAAGTPERTRRELEKFSNLDGVDAIAVGLPRTATLPEIEATLSALAPT